MKKSQTTGDQASAQSNGSERWDRDDNLWEQDEYRENVKHSLATPTLVEENGESCTNTRKRGLSRHGPFCIVHPTWKIQAFSRVRLHLSSCRATTTTITCPPLPSPAATHTHSLTCPGVVAAAAISVEIKFPSSFAGVRSKGEDNFIVLSAGECWLVCSYWPLTNSARNSFGETLLLSVLSVRSSRGDP